MKIYQKIGGGRKGFPIVEEVCEVGESSLPNGSIQMHPSPVTFPPKLYVLGNMDFGVLLLSHVR